jgi:hypothetical protein
MTRLVIVVGRSSGVIVAFVQVPWRSGLPSGVRGRVQALVAGAGLAEETVRAAGFAVGACAPADEKANAAPTIVMVTCFVTLASRSDRGSEDPRYC